MTIDHSRTMTPFERAAADRVRLARRAPFALPRLLQAKADRQKLKARLLAIPRHHRTDSDWHALGRIADHELLEDAGVLSCPFEPKYQEQRSLR
jgi:hypothetical protein